MKLFKKRKNKVLLLTAVTAAAGSIAIGALIYSATADAKYGKNLRLDASDSNLIASDRNDLSKTVDSTRDNNIPQVPKPPVVVPKPETPKVIVTPPKPKEEPKPEPKPIPEPKPEPKPEPIPQPKPEPIPEPEPIPTPPAKEPEIPKTTPEPPTTTYVPIPGRKWTTIVINGVTVEAEITPQPERQVSDTDKQKEIANPNPYQNIIVDKLHRIKVTDELRKATIEKALNGGEGNKVGLFDDFRITYLTEHVNDLDLAEKLATGTENNRYNWNNVLFRYRDLLDSENVIKFLKPEAQKEYPNKKFNSQTQRYIWLIANLDQTKFVKMAKRSEEMLEQGLTIDPRNSRINENGEIDSNSWSPPAAHNTVTSRMQRDNSKRRVFGYDSYYWRGSGDIEEGKYEGWTKKDITNSEEFKKYNVGNGDGIKISELTRNVPKQDELNKGIVVEIDAANPDGYQKTKELIEKLKNDNVQITSYRIKNMGSTDAGQKFKDILSVLPDSLPQLELFFSANATNTSSLIALEGKKIKELSLYTMGNSLLEEWSFNPWALKKVEWVNTIDYNVSSDYPKNVPIATRITFDTIAFDEQDYSGNDDFTRINNGLRMVYYTRNNEPFFQGSFGPGLAPDFNEGDNSYPMGLDFSRVPKIKTLRGLVFHDIEKSSNKPRKVRRVKFFNDKEYYELSAKDLDNAGFENLVLGEREKPKIRFSNGDATTKIRITDKEKLSSSAIFNLGRFFTFNSTLGSNKTIQIPQDASPELRDQLKSLGCNVETANDIQFT
ncbi:putative immunoglobulin-blocking virulence protein [Mycoplasmopsis hyopharyngis]|uniref:putative immunoglobulin-blocking virulence protein n=1 Tax=Mycoplasmopsis hyopharyngis TaxID=29558 RepID=UPI0038733F50